MLDEHYIMVNLHITPIPRIQILILLIKLYFFPGAFNVSLNKISKTSPPHEETFAYFASETTDNCIVHAGGSKHDDILHYMKQTESQKI